MSKSESTPSESIGRIGTNPRTAIRDAILANVSAHLDAPAVRAVESASAQATRAAVQSPEPRLGLLGRIQRRSESPGGAVDAQRLPAPLGARRRPHEAVPPLQDLRARGGRPMSEHTFRIECDGDMAAVTITDIGGDELADEIADCVQQRFGGE